MQRLSIVSAFLLASLVQPALAQSATEHSAHHPDQKEAPASDAGKPTTGANPPQSMMGDRMVKMMGSMSMSDMMQMMSGMGRPSDDGMDGLEMLDHVEGRIAFLRAELKITDAQTSAWSGFADALRARAKMLGELRSTMMGNTGSETLLDRLTAQEKWLSARLDATRSLRTTLGNLVATFSDEQKTAADELLAPNLGIMPMAKQGSRMSSMRMQRGN